ncbi:MAG: potassium channel protein [Magnetococcales bacterium]|nr:potassium channel protein [Magnetococcales bacterium]
MLGRFRPPIIALILVCTIGVLGLMIIDDYPFLDAIYQTVFTLTTVGYQETHPLSYGGKMFIVALILGGVAVWSYAIGVTVSVVVSEDLIGRIREALMEHKVKSYTDHFIIVGYTDVARQTVKMLERQKIPYVVLDDDSERLKLAESDFISEVLPFNPFRSDSFRRAKADTARGIIVTFPEDADNITVVVTGKILEEEYDKRILIISVASHKEAREKLTKVGADVVILPNELIGQRISAMAIHPPDMEQSSFLDRVAFGEFHGLDIREVVVPKESPLDGVSLKDCGLRRETGAHILGIQRRRRRRILLMPNPETIMNAQDVVLVMGTTHQLKQVNIFLEHQDENE